MRPSFWNAERDAVLSRLREDGLSNEDIAERLGCSKSAVKNRVINLDLPRRGARFALFFTPERDDVLRRLWAEGVQLKTIREALGGGVSMSAISLRAQALRLPSRWRKGLNGYIPPKALARTAPPPPKPRIVYPAVTGCTFIDPHGDGSRCGKGETQTCAAHRERMMPIPKGMIRYSPSGTGADFRVSSRRYA